MSGSTVWTDGLFSTNLLFFMIDLIGMNSAMFDETEEELFFYNANCFWSLQMLVELWVTMEKLAGVEKLCPLGAVVTADDEFV